MDDLPAVENRALRLQHGLHSSVKWVHRNEISDAVAFIVNELVTKIRVTLYHLFGAVSNPVLDDII